MTENLEDTKRRLLKLLGSAASYNDKGYEWCGHSAEKIQEMQQGFQRDQITLAREIGEGTLGFELRSAIETGAAARDWSGRYASLAEELFGIRC